MTGRRSSLRLLERVAVAVVVAADVSELRTRTASVEQILRTVE